MLNFFPSIDGSSAGPRVGPHGLDHLAVDLQKHALGAIVPPLLLVLALDDWEGLRDVGDGVTKVWGEGSRLQLMATRCFLTSAVVIPIQLSPSVLLGLPRC
jgi:hypothetical protein